MNQVLLIPYLLLLFGTTSPNNGASIVGAPAMDFRQPQLAASGKTVAATFGSKESIFIAISHDNGSTFGAPERVAVLPGLNLGMHRGPRVAFSGSTLVITAVNGRTDGDLQAWRSVDGGKVWTGPIPVSDSTKAAANGSGKEGSAREGLHAMVTLPDGTLFATWLDLRNLVPGKPGTELWGAYSINAGKTWSKNVLVYRSPDGSICQCCHPSLMADSKGVLHVMWRNVMGPSRDLYTATSTDGGKTWADASKLGNGTWELNACPMDGGGIGVDAKGQVVTAWRRESKLYLARAGQPEQYLADGKNPALAVGRAGAFVVWSSPKGVEARLAGRDKVELLDAEGSFPQALALPDGRVLAAWEHKGTLQFKTF